MSCRFCRVALCCASLCSDMFGVVLLCRVVLCCIALCYIMSWVVVLHCVMFDCVRVCCVAKSLGCGFAFVPVAHKYLYIFLWSERRPGQTLIHKRFCEMAGFASPSTPPPHCIQDASLTSKHAKTCFPESLLAGASGAPSLHTSLPLHPGCWSHLQAR